MKLFTQYFPIDENAGSFTDCDITVTIGVFTFYSQPTAQKKLRKEINEAVAKQDDAVTYFNGFVKYFRILETAFTFRIHERTSTQKIMLCGNKRIVFQISGLCPRNAYIISEARAFGAQSRKQDALSNRNRTKLVCSLSHKYHNSKN